MTGDVFYPGELVEVTASHDRRNVGVTGHVVEIIDGHYYSLDTIPNHCFDAGCLRRKEKGI